MKPIKSAPPDFMKRYDAVMNGDEKLDTVQKLKDFWLFAIEQGWPHPEMREHIASLMIDVLQKNRDSFPFGLYPTIWYLLGSIESATVIGGSDNEQYNTRENYDRAWWHLKKDLENMLRPEICEDGDILVAVPQAFKARYEAIYSGRQTIKSVQDMKDFLFFGIEQGWPYPDMRPSIAGLMFRVLIRSRIFFETPKVYLRVWTAAINVQNYAVAGAVSDGKFDAEYSDICWSRAKEQVEDLYIGSE